jgi:protein-disulfide isomerase
MNASKKMILIVVALFLSVGTYFLAKKIYQQNKYSEAAFLSTENGKTLLPEYAVRTGAEKPLVYLVEFLDPECESCRAFSPLVKSLMNEFEGKIQLVIRYAAFHGNSEMVIKILEASRKQDKYWQVLDVLFQHQPEWGSHHDPRPDLVWHYLKQTGIDLEKIKIDMNDSKIVEIIENDKKDGATLGVTGTPSFFVNGKPLEVFGYEPLRQMIQKV